MLKKLIIFSLLMMFCINMPALATGNDDGIEYLYEMNFEKIETGTDATTLGFVSTGATAMVDEKDGRKAMKLTVAGETGNVNTGNILKNIV